LWAQPALESILSKRKAALTADSSTTASSALLVLLKTFAAEFFRTHVSYAATVKVDLQKENRRKL
jgi:hypothetical protein